MTDLDYTEWLRLQRVLGETEAERDQLRQELERLRTELPPLIGERLASVMSERDRYCRELQQLRAGVRAELGWLPRPCAGCGQTHGALFACTKHDPETLARVERLRQLLGEP